MMKIFNSLWVKIQIYFASSYTVGKIYSKYYDVKIGKNVRFTGKDIYFGSEGYLIDIGDNCTITGGVIFETHDGGVGLFRKEYPGINVFGRIRVGDNVFIGNRAIIMPNVTIGNNVIIGAGSIVTKSVPSGSVAAGIPARVIKSFDEYKAKALQNAIYIYSQDPELRKIEILSKLNGH
jgi:acetyltransferase-like isoleucine patch superfamily enzyme